MIEQNIEKQTHTIALENIQDVHGIRQITDLYKTRRIPRKIANTEATWSSLQIDKDIRQFIGSQ